MKIRLATWKIKTLLQKKQKINPKPQYQRTSVWSLAKKKLFIDSILRGYDVPKFYLREISIDTVFDFEITDGQQRMRAIWEFMSDDENEQYALDEAIIKGVNTKGLIYSKLGELKPDFDDYILNIAIIHQSSPEEIRSLFARLQMGEQLNKVELRHAMSSNIGAAIISVADNHTFFENSKIPKRRYKHQDYLDHVLTLAFYNETSDIKAKNIENMYKELANSTSDMFQEYINKTNHVLDWMESMNNLSRGIFKNKWAFVDVFWLLYKNYDNIEKIDNSFFVNRFKIFEQKRRVNNKYPEKLIEDPTLPNYDKDMYDYIMAFKYSGNSKNNIVKRNSIFIRNFIEKGIYLK
jgi:hypothetical protein